MSGTLTLCEVLRGGKRGAALEEVARKVLWRLSIAKYFLNKNCVRERDTGRYWQIQFRYTLSLSLSGFCHLLFSLFSCYAVWVAPEIREFRANIVRRSDEQQQKLQLDWTFHLPRSQKNRTQRRKRTKKQIHVVASPV